MDHFGKKARIQIYQDRSLPDMVYFTVHGEILLLSRRIVFRVDKLSSHRVLDEPI